MVRASSVAAAAKYRERSWPPSQSKSRERPGTPRSAHTPGRSALFASGNRARMVGGPNYHQRGADLRVRLRVVRSPLRGAGGVPRRPRDRGRRLPGVRLGGGRAPALDLIRAAAAADDAQSKAPPGGASAASIGAAPRSASSGSAPPSDRPPGGGRAHERRRVAPRGARRGLQPGLGLRALPAVGDAKPGGLRVRQCRCRPDVRRGGAGCRGGSPGPAVRGACRCLPHRPARGDRAEP